MISNLVSINVVIAKIVRDLGLNHSNEEIPENDFIEWIAEALLHVGAYAQFQEKYIELEVDNFGAELPCDFYNLIKINNSYSSNYINKGLINEECSTSDYKMTSNGYNINFNKITTGYRYGSIGLTYMAFPVDQDGAPLIPDNQSYKDLCFWKIVYQLAIRGYNFTNPQLKDINFSRQKLNFYTLQSRAEANMASPDMMNSLTRYWRSWGTSGGKNKSFNSWNSYKF